MRKQQETNNKKQMKMQEEINNKQKRGPCD